MISINATLVVQLINFLILLWILNKILIKPVLGLIEARERSVEDLKLKMENLQVEADEKKRWIERRISKARRRGAHEADEARNEAEAQAKDMIHEVQAQAKDHVNTVQEEVKRQADDERRHMDQHQEVIAGMVFQKLMGRDA